MPIVFSAICFGVCAALFILIGVMNIKDKNACGFYASEKGPAADKLLIDVKEWNLKHGRAWILYGVWCIVCWVLTLFTPDTVVMMLLVYTGGLLLPIPFLIGNHIHLEKKYVKR